MNALQSYRAYKDPGVALLGAVPEHWEVRSLGTFGRFFKGSGGTKADETGQGVPCVRYGDLYTRHRFHITASKACVAPHRAGAYTPVRYGDVLFAGSGETLEEIGKSAVNLIRGSAVCGGDVIVFRPAIDVDAEFIGWSTDCRHAASQKARMGRGITVMHIYSSDLKYLAVPLPPLPEQTAIARFLNDADRRIRRYIRAKERLIELLDEERRATIHEAVTGRIDVRTGQPYPSYKDSGVEWLGEVPEHWEVKKLKYITRFRNGIAFKPSDWRDAGVPIIRIENLNGSDGFNYTDRSDLPEELLIQPGDILFAWSGNRGTSFGSFQWERGFIGYLNQHIFKLTDYRIHRRYFFYVLRAVTKDVEDNAHGIIGLVHITKPTLGAISVPVAPNGEQEAIATWLDRQRVRIDHSIERAARQVRLAQEFRTRLIADVVTGKLDVREAAKLPETALLAADRDRAGTIPSESNPHSTESDMMKEAVP